MKFEDINWSYVLDKASDVASVFNPVVGKGLMVASDVLDNVLNQNDDDLEYSVFGLTRSSDLIDEMVKNKNVDFKTLDLISKNLKLLNEVINKTSKIVR